MTTQRVGNEAGNLGPPRYKLAFSITLCCGCLGTTVLGPGTADLSRLRPLSSAGRLCMRLAYFPLFVFKSPSQSERQMRPAYLLPGEEC